MSLTESDHAPDAPRGVRMRASAVAALLVAAALGGCGERGIASAPEPKPPTVAVVTARATDVPLEYSFVGQTAATRSVEIRARVPGFLTAVEYSEGESVQEGEVLFRLDPRPFEADLEVVKAELDEAEASLAAAESDVRRFAELLAKEAGSQKEYDDALASKAAAVARIRAAQARIARGELELGFTVITSPLTGVAGAAQKDLGAYVDGSADSLLVEVIETDPIDVNFTVSQREIEATRRAEREGRLRAPSDGKVTLELTLLDGTTYPHIGSINFADIQVDPATGATRVRAGFPNPESALRPGQFVRGKLKGFVRPAAVTVPRASVVQSPAGASVFIVDGGETVQVRPVTLGEWIGTEVVVLSGIAAGDRVIKDGQLRVAPGTRVIVAEEGDTPPPAAATQPR